MALPLKESTAASAKPVAAPARRTPAPPQRKAFRDNTKLLLVGIAVLLAALAGLLALASRSDDTREYSCGIAGAAASVTRTTGGAPAAVRGPTR